MLLRSRFQTQFSSDNKPRLNPTVAALTFNPFQENTFVIWDEKKECAIVDPGCLDQHEKDQLAHFIEQNGLKPTQLLLTHVHVDHVLGNGFVKEKYGLSPIMHEEGMKPYEAVADYGKTWGFNDIEIVPPASFLNDGDTVNIGDSKWEVIYTPGHCPGEVCFYHEPSKQLIAGDVLFQGSIGRTDLPGGDHALLIRVIKERLLPLPDDVIVYAGHGPSTNIGFERAHNPFLQ